MYDTTIHVGTLRRHLRKSDFEPGPFQSSAQGKEATVAHAVHLATQGIPSISLRRGRSGGKVVYQQTSLAEALLVRHATENVRRLTGVKQADRESIIKCLKALAGEGLSFKIIRLDIHAFYESIDPGPIIDDLHKDSGFSRQSVQVLRSLFVTLRNQGISGLPRGLGLSATLSEYLMRRFDDEVRRMRGVRFYSRYVDDMIFVLSPRENVNEVQARCRDLLPAPLSFNRRKSNSFEFQVTRGSGAPVLEHAIDFLGYCLQISSTYRPEDLLKRDVTIDISTKKVAKIKSRIARSILEFNRGGLFKDLHDRVRFLTGNYQLVDQKTGQIRYAGLRYNYALIDGARSQALNNLDRFLYNALFSGHQKNRLAPSLSSAEARLLRGYGFKRGFVENHFFSFGAGDLRRVGGCWAHA
jgi:hypothetical protein